MSENCTGTDGATSTTSVSGGKQGERQPLLQFFSHPAVGIAGSIASIAGIILSIYFYRASLEKPELTYFVHPVKAAVVRTGQTSGMTVQFGGQVLDSDVTAAQIAFWNAGRRPIRTSAVLSPLVIRIADNRRILEAKLRKTSRDVAGLTVDTSRLASGEVGVGWHILEQNDGGVLQIVYAGSETVGIQATAAVESQPEIFRVDYPKELPSPSDEYTRRQGLVARLPGYVMIPIGFAMTIVSVSMVWRKQAKGEKVSRFSIAFVAYGLVPIGMGVWTLLFEHPPGPPFGF